jgi:hydrogenase nickel insertion protein HypA
MHEFSITQSIIDILKNTVKERKIEKVLKVNFLVNNYGGIEPESIKFYYGFLTKDDNTLKDARLIFRKEKIKVSCLDCGSSFEVSRMVSECNKCSSKNISISFPEDIKIKSIVI